MVNVLEAKALRVLVGEGSRRRESSKVPVVKVLKECNLEAACIWN